MNRKGLDAVSILPFVFLLFLLGAGLAIGSAAFYGRHYEFRDVETRTLAEIVNKCLAEKDFFSSEFDISQCGLNKAAVEKEHLLYVKRGDGKEFFVGVINYRTECALSNKNDAYAHCIYFNTTSGNAHVEVVVGSNQHVIRGLV